MAAVESARDEVRMPIRLVDGEKAWEADKLAACREEFVPHYFMLLPLAMANGSFEYNLRDITRRVYGKTMPTMTQDQLAAILVQFQRVKLLFSWRTQDGKLWGYWTKIERRLPPVSQVRRGDYGLGAPVPVEGLAEFLGKSVEEVRAELAGTAAELKPCDRVRRRAGMGNRREPRYPPGTESGATRGIPRQVEDRNRRGTGLGGGRGGDGNSGHLSARSSSSPTAPPASAQREIHQKKNNGQRWENPAGQLRNAGNYTLFEQKYWEFTGRLPGGSLEKQGLYQELCQSWTEEAVLEAVQSWAAQRGGPGTLHGNRFAVWDFLRRECRAEIEGARNQQAAQGRSFAERLQKHTMVDASTRALLEKAANHSLGKP